MNEIKNQWTCKGSDSYLSCVNYFLNSENGINIFRNGQFGGYTQILEHIDYYGGLSYLNWIKQQDINLNEVFSIAKKNDFVGSPIIFSYESHKFNPTTLRYLKYAIEIIQYFGKLKNCNYIEVGAGYGGLVRILSEFYNFDSINLFDIPEVLNLQEKYLSNYSIKINKCSVLENFDVPENTIFVSNYALSELTEESRKLYIEKILPKCKYIFIASNDKKLKQELSSFPMQIGVDCFDDTELLIIKNK